MSQEAIAAVARWWTEGQTILEAALREAERGIMPPDKVFERMQKASKELRKQLRRIEADIEDLDADTWIPWRSDHPQLLASADEYLRLSCQDVIVRKFPVEWEKIESHATAVREWFRKIAADTKADTSKKSLVSVPQTTRLANFCKKRKRDLRPGVRQVDLALDFTNGDKDKAQTLLREARRFKHIWHSKHRKTKADT